MSPFSIVSGIGVPLRGSNIDTDVIMPKRFLKGIDRKGLADGTFADLRFDEKGGCRTEFILNITHWQNPKFLIVGPNFGCGSSREHAVWGLMQLGIRALVGTTFAGIFFDNCARNGLLAISVSGEDIARCMELVSSPDTNNLIVDLPQQEIRPAMGEPILFRIDPDRKATIMQGLDWVDVSLSRRVQIENFQRAYFLENPWLM